MEGYHDNDNLSEMHTFMDDKYEPLGIYFLTDMLIHVLSCPAYILAILVPIQLAIHLLTNGTGHKSGLGKLGVLNIALTLFQAYVISLKRATEMDIESSMSQFPMQFFSARYETLTYIVMAFITFLDRVRVSNMNVILQLFWSSTFVSVTINLYRDISVDTYSKNGATFWIDLTHLVTVIIQCFLLYARRKKVDEEKGDKMRVHPQERASWLSDFTLNWTTGIIKIGSKRTLRESDVFDLAPRDQSRYAVAKLEKTLKNHYPAQTDSDGEQYKKEEYTKLEKEDATKLQGFQIKATMHVSLLTVLIKTFGLKFFSLQFVKALGELTDFINPVFLAAFMNHIESRDKEKWTKGVAIVCGIFAVNVLNHLFQHRLWCEVLRVGKRVRGSIILAVFKKALTVRNEATKDFTTGEIVNLISDDCDRFVNMSHECFHIISSPMVIGVSFYLLYDQVGFAMFIGIIIMLFLIPLNLYVGKKMKSLYTERDDAKDKRTKLMNEIISGIKVLKLYAWERSFMKKVDDIRRKEEECNNALSFLHACIDSMFRAIPFLVKLGSFGVYLLLGGHLDPVTGFVTINLFHIMNHPFSLLPLLIPRYVEAAASLKRIEKFMNGEDFPRDNVVSNVNNKSAISISEGEFAWERTKETNTLRNINVDIPKDSLVAVVGMVGTGKSSLLSALLGEMEKLKGVVKVNGKVAYVPQEAWILNASLKENILFGSQLEQDKYRSVTDACALKRDFDMMKAGDKTEIGEKGINLSGGQKQRVSLARALYNDADIFLLDDPLSAVDTHVGKQIFNEVISHNGLLKGKTRVLVTHGLHWLSRVDSIIVMKDGEISESGTYDQLLSHDGPFAQFLLNVIKTSSEDPNSKVVRRTLSRLASIPNYQFQSSEEDHMSETTKMLRQISMEYISSDSSDDEEEVELEDLKKLESDKQGALIDDEELEQGRVDRKVYLKYIKAVGYKLVFGFSLLYFITAVFDTYNTFVIKQWTDDSLLANQSLATSEKYKARNWQHFHWFAVTGAIEVVTAFLFVVVTLRGTFQAATFLHNNLLYRILRCPMAFFDTTPSSRIITRFSKDVTRVDELGGCLSRLICLFFSIILYLFVIVISCPAVCFHLVPITIAYSVIFYFHVGPIRQLRRFKSKYRSPMYAHFTETLNGLASIRAYTYQNRFIESMEKQIDEYTKFDLMELWCAMGLGIRSGFLYHVISLITGIICVMDTNMTTGMVGLVIMLSKDFSERTNGFLWTVTHAETEIVALEKVIEYSNKPMEAEWDIAESKSQSDWPSEGHVSFNKYKARYREGLDLVLKGVDCKIRNGEKVGIVGRTGAGKTSLTMAFFRLLEAAEGKIIVDGINIADLGLHDLRSRINILPQEPIIFSGTLRMNLDPFDKHSDEDIWTALERSHLEWFVNGLPNALEYECGEGGKNLSVGQKQLLCLARTLLRKTKILVLDEATAAVDMETDELIQKTIRSEFKDCTILTIAHRLNTIMDYDKILVLEYGLVKEFDTPRRLLANPDSTFYSMAKDAKLVQ